MNRGLIIMAVTGVLLIIGLSIGLAVVALSNSKTKEEAVCLTSGCVDTASKILKDLNPEVEPCNNFYEFACGGYLASAPVPDGEISVDRLSSIARDIENQLKQLIQVPIDPNEARPFKLAKTLYRTCMNTSALDKAGVAPLRKILREFGNWPVIEGDYWKEDDFNWMESVYKSRKLGYSYDNFVNLAVDVDWKNTTNHMLSLDQPTFGLLHTFLIEGSEYPVVKAYFNFMVDIAVLLGANKARAIRELTESLNFEMNLANNALPEEERKNYTLLDNPMTIEQLNKKYPIVNWEEYINKLLPPSIHVDANEIVTVREPSYMVGLNKLINDTPKRIQANYAVWRVVAESVKYLTEDLRKRESKYTAEISGNVKTTSDPRWKECLTMITESFLSSSINALYVRNYFKENARQNAVEMVADIKTEMIKTLQKADWMDEETRTKAIEKAESMISFVGYPVELLDDNELEKFYANLTLKPDGLFQNILDVNRLEADYSLEELRKPVNRTDWVSHDSSADANAFYDPSGNSIQLPAGILQGVFFNNDRPRYMNYGAMGFMIGHESTHGFDNEGRQFDKDGNVVDWWTTKTARKYLEKAQCIINQYNNYTVPSVGLNVDGENTLGENIADNGGLKMAYQAYNEYVDRNGPEPKLPGLKYTPKQLFWISSASIWCSRYRPESAHYELTTDVHSPERFRVIGSLANLPEFADDFNCPVGSQMNPPKKCSVL